MTTVVSVSAPAAPSQIHTARPTFLDVLGELFKVSRQRGTWLMGVLLRGDLRLPLSDLAGQPPEGQRESNSSWAIYRLMSVDMLVLRVFAGALLIMVTARLIGMEYSGGTIRVMLARGVGRLQLLFGKLTALAILRSPSSSSPCCSICC